MNISRRKAVSKREKKARKRQRKARILQRKECKQRKNFLRVKRLTPEQKKRRSEQIIQRKESKQKRKQLNKDKDCTQQINRIETTLAKIFDSEMLNQLAKATGFIKRTGEITAFSFMYIVSFGFFGNGEIALTYLVAGLQKHFNVIISSQALSKRINSPSAVKYLKAILMKLIAAQLKIALKNKFSQLLPEFNGIYLQDSSQITLNESLSQDFKGNGGGASKSALKLDFIYDIANFLVYGVKISSSIVSDHNHSKEIIKYIKASSLVIRDLGYFSIDVLKKIQHKGAYYISRLSITTNIYLNKEDETPLNVPEFLKKLHNEGKDLSNIKIYIGKEEKFESRLVAEKVPSYVSMQRTKRFKDDRKKEPTQYYVDWSGFSIFVTNIPENMFSSKIILALYKIRWQIELVFCNLKLNVEIDIIKGTKKNRVESLIYGKFITIVVLYIIQNYAAHIAKDKEISGDKIVKLMKADNQLREAIIKNDLGMLLIILENDILLVCKQKRNRDTTYEILKKALAVESKREKSITHLNIHVNDIIEVKHFQEVI
jgi:hypothetical protein